MIKFKEKLLYKYLNEEHLNELERKKFNEYVDKIYTLESINELIRDYKN